MNDRPEILLAAMKEAEGDLSVTALISDAMACETHFGLVAEVIESLQRFPQSAKVKERNGVLFVEVGDQEFDFDAASHLIPNFATTATYPVLYPPDAYH